MDKDNQDTGWAKMSETDEIRHQQTIVVEGLRSDFKFVIEKVDGMEERLVLRMDEKFSEQDERFDRIEAVLKVHSQLLNKNEERWNQNDQKLQRIENKLDHIDERVEKHDQELREIKAVIGN